MSINLGRLSLFVVLYFELCVAAAVDDGCQRRQPFSDVASRTVLADVVLVPLVT